MIRVSAVALVPAVASSSDVSPREELVACARPVETTNPTFREMVDAALDRIFLRVIDCWGLPGPLGPFYTPKQTQFLKALGAVREANAQGKVVEGDIVDSEGNAGPTGETSAERLDENGNPVSTAAVGAGDEVVTIDTDDILPASRDLADDYQTFQATLIHEGSRLLQESMNVVASDMPEPGNPERLGEQGAKITNDLQAVCHGQDAWALDDTHWELVLCLGTIGPEYVDGVDITMKKLRRLRLVKQSAESQLQQAIAEGK